MGRAEGLRGEIVKGHAGLRCMNGGAGFLFLGFWIMLFLFFLDGFRGGFILERFSIFFSFLFISFLCITIQMAFNDRC